MNSLEQIDFSGKRALVRVDFNVPLNDSLEITDDTRILRALPTIQHILNEGGSVVLMSHLGRPKEQEDKFSLVHVVERLSQVLERDIKFADDCVSEAAFTQSGSLQPGEVLLLNNLRYYNEEKAGNIDFAKQLSKHGDIYVNDAFGTAHRAHASTSIIAQFFGENKTLGFLMGKEVENANRLLNNPKRPFVAITGGAKVSDKIQILDNLIGKADHILIGGGMAYTFLKAMGGEIGSSLCEDEKLDLAKELIQKAEANGTTLHLPTDSTLADEFSAEAKTVVMSSDEIPSGWMGLDIGPLAIEEYTAVVLAAESILWNGPMGVFEFEKFSNGTKAVAAAVAQSTNNGAYSLIGGGDSAAAVNQFGYGDDVSHVSTGGGALLELFEGKQLPGIKAIMD